MKKYFILIIVLVLFPVLGFAALIMSSDVESATTCDNVFAGGINTYDGGACAISTTYAHSGSKSVRLTYPNDEAGTELHSPHFTGSQTLYTRKYEYFDSNWAGNWPIGLKTSRYFTAGTTYHSEKMIWQTYDSNCNEEYGMGMNSAVLNLDLEQMYSANWLFGNGLPYIRTGHWYKIETWMVMNSADNATDGTLQIWIDDVQVYNKTNLAWESSTRGATGGLDGWTDMWFGGNYSGATCGNPSTTLYRYIDDVYLSTTLDRADETAPTALTKVISANGTTFTITYDEAVSQGAGYDDSDINVDCSTGGNDIAVTYVSGDDTTTHVYTLSKTVLPGETCNVDFDGSANSLEDSSGNDLAAINSGSVTNNSSVDVVAPTLSNLLPAGTVSYEATKTLSVTTNENATCRYHATQTTWANMTEMEATGGTTSTQSVSVEPSTEYTCHILCRDGSENESEAGTITFTTLGGSGGSAGCTLSATGTGSLVFSSGITGGVQVSH